MRSITRNAFRRLAAGTKGRGHYIAGGRLMRSITRNAFRRLAAGAKGRRHYIRKGGIQR